MSFFNVKIFYGPCTSFHDLEHRPQRLKGLQAQLQKYGYTVELIQVSYVNYCLISICGHEVFRCNPKNLKFNMHYTRDPVARRAVEAVFAASKKLQLARTHLWFRNLLNENLLNIGPYTPKDYWPEDVEVKPYVACRECVACCDINVSRKSMREQTTSKCYDYPFVSDSDYLLNVGADPIK